MTFSLLGADKRHWVVISQGHGRDADLFARNIFCPTLIAWERDKSGRHVAHNSATSSQLCNVVSVDLL
ncbi:hypothetical protein ACQXZL_05725 [Corynebacterium diphtheriae]|uniref:hypothetical protein n=1 Tax=Corynebacterium diphtheriae TaxID=1717 RepID=UPI0002468196|nr:hypothetical protein [Corynebacterium diphtheriae]AEX72769.1 hypothetical protein CDCE8392_1783 [Corynebacterium diphtheriae CDCE 8392]MBG9222628.1 hypothetical protein [Corynebacterium diphtheriae bv. mitis]MBG9302094.1 hypothetical protein [Corynebacterium diphtheriae bv. mitis]MCM0041008.1 hypothetical protein [Corynebacterium diphtheriae bv. mitis]MCM0046892.1 hypothetical protein [Corynebacterium diphtheriae bv. mitis]